MYEVLRRTARHEAAHAEVALLLGCANVHARLKSEWTGEVQFEEPDDPRAKGLIGLAGAAVELLDREPSACAADLVAYCEGGGLSPSDAQCVPVVSDALAGEALQIVRSLDASIKRRATEIQLAFVRERAHRGAVYL